jgi:hypothetical protein
MRRNRSGISRRRFLGTAGAAGMAGAAMMGSGVAMAQPHQKKYKIGVLSAEEAEFGPPQRDLLVWLIENSPNGHLFEVYTGDSTCGEEGEDPLRLFRTIFDMKDEGVDFFVGVSCSGSAQVLMTKPTKAEAYNDSEYYTRFMSMWATSCFMNTGANSGSIELWAQQKGPSTGGSLHLHSNDITCARGSYPIGYQIGEEMQPGGMYEGKKIVQITEDAAFPEGLAIGVRTGLSEWGLVPDLDIKVLINTDDIPGSVANVEAALLDILDQGYGDGTSILIMNPYNKDENDIFCEAYNNLGDARKDFILYGSYGFANVARLGGPPYYDASASKNRKYIPGLIAADYDLSQDWLDNDDDGNGTDWLDEYERLYDEIPAIMDDMLSQWGAQIWIMHQVDAANLMMDLIIRERGNVQRVNKALATETFQTFAGPATWNYPDPGTKPYDHCFVQYGPTNSFDLLADYWYTFPMI